MKIGVPSEIKAQESRVGLTPQSVKELVKDNHTAVSYTHLTLPTNREV